MITVLNAIRFNNSLLEKIFEGQKFSEYGIYFAKVNQNGSWKYVTIDDHIPVVKNKKTGKMVHAFFEIENTDRLSDTLEIWPILLMKVYAKVYSNYESLSK